MPATLKLLSFANHLVFNVGNNRFAEKCGSRLGHHPPPIVEGVRFWATLLPISGPL